LGERFLKGGFARRRFRISGLDWQRRSCSQTTAAWYPCARLAAHIALGIEQLLLRTPQVAFAGNGREPKPACRR
jgi:hypothetical protein